MSETPASPGPGNAATADAVIERVLLRLLPAIESRIDAKIAALAPAPRRSALEGAWEFLRGKKTIIVALMLPIAPVVAENLAHTDWQKLGLSPAAGAVIAAVVIGLRAVTTGPIGGPPKEK